MHPYALALLINQRVHSDTDRQLASEALRFTYRIAMQGDSEMRQAILDRSLEGLIKLHSHDNYATHAEAAESIKELASDPNILPGLIQRLAIILDKFSSGENLLSTSLLVVEDLASTPNEEAREYCMEMSRTGIPSLLIVLERYAHVQFNYISHDLLILGCVSLDTILLLWLKAEQNRPLLLSTECVQCS